MRGSARWIVASQIARFALALILVASVTLGALPPPLGSGTAPIADAAGANGLTIDQSADSDPLIGGATIYTLSVTNVGFAAGAQNPDGKAYNLDLTDVLPPGVSFVSSPLGAPSITTTSVAGVIQQTLLFSNVTDIAISQTYTTTITASLAAGPGNLGVPIPNTSLTNTASAAVSNDPRLPASTSAGSIPFGTTALPFKLTKATTQSTGVSQDTGGCPAQGTGAGRGFSYLLTASNNSLGSSSGAVIVETLPYGVDYCGTSASTGGTFTPTATRNADGTTTLTYVLGTLTSGATVTVSPDVAIPYTYASGAPITDGKAGTPVADAASFVNTAHLSGTYASAVNDTGAKTSSVTAKYATVANTGAPASVGYGTTVNYSVDSSTSNNYAIDTEYLIDTLPDGEDYSIGSANIGAVLFPPTVVPIGVYSPCAGSTSPAPGVFLCGNGTTVLTWGPINDTGPTPTAAGTSFQIDFDAVVRTTYRASGLPVVLTDPLINHVLITYNATSVGGLAPVNHVTRAGGGAVDDTALAEQTSGLPTLTKTVTAVHLGDGTPPPMNEGRVVDPKTALAAVGDIVTFQIAYTGSPGQNQKGIILSDFLPRNLQYVVGSSAYSGSYSGLINGAALGSHPDPACASTCPAGSLLIYELGGPSGTVAVGQSLTISLNAQVVSALPPLVTTNLAKFSGASTAGLAYSGRDQVSVSILGPALTLTKANNAPNPSLGGQAFSYTLTLHNSGSSTAYRIADLIDTLPADVQYVSTTSTTPGAAAGAAIYAPGSAVPGFGGTVSFPNVAPIAPGGTVAIVYAAVLQPVPSVGTIETNTARIASYSSQPPAVPVGPIFPAVSAASDVNIGGQALTKTATLVATAVNGPGGRVTVGDQVDYVITYQIPANTTVTAGQIRDCLPLGFHYVGSSYTRAVTSGTLPTPASFPTTEAGGGFTAGSNGSGPCPSDQEQVLVSTGTQANNTGVPIVLEIHLRASITGRNQIGTQRFTVIPGPNNTTGGLPNTNKAFFFNGSTQIATISTPAIDVYIPHLTLAKTRMRPVTSPPTLGGATVDFLLALRNTGGSAAYDIADLVDTLDPALAFVAAYASDASCTLIGSPLPVTQVGQVVTIPVATNPLANGSFNYVCVHTTLIVGASPSTSYPNAVTLGASGSQYFSAPATYTGRAAFAGTAGANAAVTTTALTVSKTELSGRPSPDGSAAPGEAISFPLQFVIPAGTTLYSPVITDPSFGAGTRLGTPTNSTAGGSPGGGTLTCSGGTTPASGAYTFSVPGGVPTFAFSGNLAADPGTSSTCVLQLDTQVRNVAANNVGTTVISNTFQVAFNASGGAAVTPIVSTAATVALLEPRLTLTKTIQSAYSATTGHATFRLQLTNASTPGTGVAYDVVIADPLPSGLVWVSNTAPTVPAGVGAASATNTPTSVGLTVASLAPGATTFVDVVVAGNGAPGAGRTLTNTATFSAADMTSVINGNSTQADPTSRRTYSGSAPVGITIPAPTYTKLPATQTIGIGSPVNFTLALSVPAGAALYDVVIGDSLPAGLVLTGTGLAFGTTPAGCPTPNVGGGGLTPLAPGTLSNSTSAACVYTVNVAAKSDGSVPAQATATQALTNTGTLAYSVTLGGATLQLSPTSAVTIQAPILALTKSALPTGPVDVGGTIAYTLTYANTGLSDAHMVVLTDTFSPSTSVTTNADGGVVGGNTITFSIGTVAANSGGTLRYSVRVNSIPVGGSIGNSAVLTSTERDPITRATTNGTTHLTATKSVAPTGPVAPGGVLTYTLTLSNPAPATQPATTIVVTDPVPANTTYVTGSGGSLAGGNVSFAVPSLAVGATATLSFQVRVNTPLTDGTVITNAATFGSAQLAPGSGTAIVSNTVQSAPVLALTKTRTPTGALGVGGQITYAIDIVNTGDEDAENVVIGDVVPTGTALVSASAPGTYTSSDQTVRWSLGTVSASGTASVSLTVAVLTNPQTGQLLAGQSIVDHATYAFANAAGGNHGQGQSPGVSNGTLSHTLSKSNAPTGAVAPGGTITYSLVYTNTGSADMTGASLTDVVPANTTFVSATAGGGLSNGVVTWSLGAVAAGQQRTVTYVVRLATPLPHGTSIDNVAHASAAGAVSGTVPDTASAAVHNQVTSAPAFTIAKSNVPTGPVFAGDAVTYTLTLGNTGDEDATGVVVRDNVPVGASYIVGSATGAPVAESAGALTWTIPSLPVSGSAVLSFQVGVVALGLSDAVPTDLVDTAAVIGSSQTGPLTSPVTSNEVRNPTVGLRLTKAVPVPGDGAPTVYDSLQTYAVSYTNIGSLPLTGARITDDVPAGTSFMDVANGGSEVTGGANNRGLVTWLPGTLAAGQTGTVTFRVRVDNPTLPDDLIIVNTAAMAVNELPVPIVSNQTANLAGPAPINTLDGLVYVDSNGNGRPDSGEAGIGGVTITLSGSDRNGAAVHSTSLTTAGGTYSFAHLLPGTYSLLESPPPNYLDGTVTPGSLGGTSSAPRGVGGIVLPNNGAGTAYDFGHLTPPALPTPTPAPAQAASPRQPAPTAVLERVATGGGGGGNGGGGGGGGATAQAVSVPGLTLLPTPVPVPDGAIAMPPPPVLIEPALAPAVAQLSLAVAPSAPLVVGQTVDLVFTTTNTGTADALGPLSVTTILTSGLHFESSPVDSGCAAGGQTVVCTSAGPLPPGGSMTLTLTVSVSAEALDGIAIVSTVSSGSSDIDVAGVQAQMIQTLVAAAAAVTDAPAPVTARDAPNTGVTGEASTGLVYVVQDGDTLASIATTIYGDPGRESDLYATNQTLIDEAGLVPGLVLVIPPLDVVPPPAADPE